MGFSLVVLHLLKAFTDPRLVGLRCHRALELSEFSAKILKTDLDFKEEDLKNETIEWRSVVLVLGFQAPAAKLNAATKASATVRRLC